MAAATALVLTALSSPAAWAADPTPAPTPSGSTGTAPPPAESEQTKAIRAACQLDLQVTARPDGGWRDVIVVKTAQAAADPQLKSLHFLWQASGVNWRQQEKLR
ncbi:hypothetical protein [Kitasatospora griseola]